MAETCPRCGSEAEDLTHCERCRVEIGTTCRCAVEQEHTEALLCSFCGHMFGPAPVEGQPVSHTYYETLDLPIALLHIGLSPEQLRAIGDWQSSQHIQVRRPL